VGWRVPQVAAKMVGIDVEGEKLTGYGVNLSLYAFSAARLLMW